MKVNAEALDQGQLSRIQEELCSSLPDSWEVTTLGDAFKWGSGGTPRSGNAEFYGGGIPWLVIGDLNDGVVHDSATTITQLGLENSSAKLVEPGAILLAMYGSIGKLGIAGRPLATNQAIAFTKPIEVVTQYLYFYLRFIRNKLASLGKGATQLNISQTVIKAFPFVLAPLNEQHRIVAKIEELFSELDKGIENLKTAREQLKVYRQALLKHAFEGKLTVQWRAANPDKLEPAASLLARIQTEREQRYRQQLQQWEATGGSKPKVPKPLLQPTAEDLAELTELPEGWGWVKLGQVFNVYVGSTPSRKRADFWNGDISWVSSGEVAFCRIKETKEKITNIGYENASTEIHPVGTVMLAMIGEGKTRGQAAILNIEATHNQNTAAIRVSESGCSPEFVYQYLVYQYEITRKIGSGNNQKALNKERVSDLIFPLCSIEEQREIVTLLDARLSEADQLELTLVTSLQQSEALRQSILKKAFSGQLVAQVANDEPAAALLERIRAEREQTATPKRGKKSA